MTSCHVIHVRNGSSVITVVSNISTLFAVIKQLHIYQYNISGKTVSVLQYSLQYQKPYRNNGIDWETRITKRESFSNMGVECLAVLTLSRVSVSTVGSTTQNHQLPPPPPLFSPLLHVLLLLWTQMLNFTLYSLWWRITPAFECSICGFRNCSQEIPPPPSKKSIFLCPVSHILLLHTDLYLSNVSPSMKSIPLSVHSFSSLSYDRSKASSKRSSPHSCHLELSPSNERILSFP
jgi:hypothetical protein